MARCRTSATITARSKEPGVRGRPMAASNSPGSSMITHSKLKALSLGLGIVLAAIPVAAQRAPSATYDSQRKVKLAGPVTKIDWVNPSAFFFVNVKDATGTVSSWAVEFGNPLDLERDG